MPVNYLQIRDQIIQMGQSTRQRQAELSARRALASDLLHAYDQQVNLVLERIQQAQKVNPNLRCALPVDNTLCGTCDLPPACPAHIILAADGSQINPNFHDPVAFGVINVGAFRMAADLPSEPPREEVTSQLLIDDELSNADGSSVGEEIVALKRDLGERNFLAELSAREQHPVVALTDGPLELFRDPKERPEFKELFNQYLQSLKQLALLNTATAGYVDRPRSDLIIRTLELMMLAEDQLALAGKPPRPFKGVSDSDLFYAMLQPAQRTAVFGIISTSAAKFIDELALHFFYINVGLPGAPAIARVEIPAWVANDSTLLNLLHHSLVAQCRVLGSAPFPYALHRAHEVAVVRLDEKNEITRMIVGEINQQGSLVGGPSNKQFHKDHSGIKKRFK